MGLGPQSKDPHPTVVPASEKLVVIIQILPLVNKGVRVLWSAIY